MTRLTKRNCAQEEGRDWARGRNTRWLPGTGDRQLAGPWGWFRVFRKARGSRERVKMQGYLCTGALALRGHENSGAHHRPARPSNASPRHPPTLSSRRSAAFPPPRPRSRSAGNGRGLGGARPSSCPDWLMQLSILNLFFDGGGGATRSAPDHVCHPQPTTLVQVRGQEAIGGKRARHPRPRPVLAGPRRNILHSRPLPHRGIGAAASQEGRSEM